MNIESELKEVLRRTDPPSGFGDRVMQRVRADFSRPAKAGPRTRFRALAAAALIAIALGGWGVHATLRARSDLMVAMRIASQKVAQAQHQVNRR
jgi:hypothetical protein